MEEQKNLPFLAKAATFGTTLVTAGVVDVAAHGGGYGLVIGAAVAGMAAYLSSDVYDGVKQIIPLSTIQRHIQPAERQRDEWTWQDRLLGRHLSGDAKPNKRTVRAQEDEMEPLQPKRPQYDFSGENELSAPMRKPQGVMLFSDTLKSFTPSLDKIYIGTLATGEMVFCKAEDLCHVALAGTTRAGKSSIMRMLLAQLCYTGTSVLVLNPHYSKYILDKKEDWTPFEPYLMHDPMECRKYDVIEHFLKQVATVLLPKRLDRFAVGQPVGKPYFLALDELPDIVKHIPDASSYLDDILRQGAKVGIFLICASQDFLVKTLKLEGGAVRECYRSAFYVGGDATTAKTLLDMPANQIDEAVLGTGTIMLRNWQVCKRSVLAYVPLVDNQVLYQLLGPSTYQQMSQRAEDDIRLEDMQPTNVPEPRNAAQFTTQEQPTRRRMATSGYDVNRQRKAQETAIRREWHASAPKQTQVKQDAQQAIKQNEQVSSEIEISLQEAFRLWSSGNDSVRDLAKALSITTYQASKLYTAMVESRMIEPKKKVVVRD